MKSDSHGTLHWVLPVALALIAAIVFSPSLFNGFVEWDDQVLFLENPNYRGLGWTQIRWMFTTTLWGHWVPLTWLTHGLDYVLWGMNPMGYHGLNVLLHAINTALFYLVALRLLAAAGFTGRTLTASATMAALFFGLHPLRAESVAWATERRDVLAGFFFLLTVILYLDALNAQAARRTWRLRASIVCYVLAFLSKSTVMTLPFVLVLFDFYPLRRLELRWALWRDGRTWALWREKLPYLWIAFAGAAVAWYAQKGLGFNPARPLIAAYGLWIYVWRTAVPLKLSPLYELPARISITDPRFLMPLILVVAVTLLLIALTRWWPAGLSLWLYYALVIAPVSGTVSTGVQVAADRYTYLACLGWALLVGSGVGLVLRAREHGQLAARLTHLALGVASLWLVGLAVLTWQQVQIWRSTETLWSFAADSEPACSICQRNVGVSLINQGRLALALERFERVRALHPDMLMHHKDVGLTLLALGRAAEAVEPLRLVLEQSPEDVEAMNALGAAVATLGRPDEARRLFQRAIQLKPDDLMVRSNLGRLDSQSPKTAVPVRTR
jgi:protein O-mannosyl-transferase